MYLGRSGFEEPVEAEAPGFPDLGLELIPGSVAKPMDHAQDEAILLLCKQQHISHGFACCIMTGSRRACKSPPAIRAFTCQSSVVSAVQ